MKLSYVFIANAVFALIGSLSLLVAPEQTFSSYGAALDQSGVFIAHMLGVVVLGIGIISYLFRKIKERSALRPVLIGFTVTHVGSTIFAFWAATAGLFNQMVWGDVIIHGALAVGFGYYLTKK